MKMASAPSDLAPKPTQPQTPSDWTRNLEAVTTSIESRTRKQQRLLERTEAPGDCPRAKTLIKSYISENANDVATAKALVKNLNDECVKTKNAMLIRTTRALGASFQRAIEESNKVENSLMQKVRNLESEGASRREHIIYAQYDEAENGKQYTAVEMNNIGDENDEGQELDQQSLKMKSRDTSNSLTAELFEAAFHERNREIGFLLEGVVEINAMMQDLNQMVIEQGEHLEEVEENMMTTHQAAVKSAENLRKAAGSQKDGSKSWLLMGAVIFLILLLIGGLVASRL